MTWRPFSAASRSCIWLLLALSALPGASADPVRIGLIDSTIYDTAVIAVLKEAGFEADITYATVDVLRQKFIKGEIVMDCCSIPEWRKRPEETGIQYFSDHFFVAADHLILSESAPALDPRDPLDMDRMRFARVKGFTYTLDSRIRREVPAETIEDAYMELAQGKADVTVFGVQEYYRMQAANPQPVKLGPVTQRYPLRIRVRSDHADLLPALNKAINSLKSNGRIDTLIGAALRAGKGTQDH